MLRSGSRAVSLWAAAGAFVFTFGLLSNSAHAAPVEIQSGVNILTANVIADLGGGGDSPGDHKESQDVADLDKRTVNAHAQATVQIPTSGGDVTTAGSVIADLAARSDGFDMTGTSATNLPDNNPFQANTTAVNNTLVPFTISDGFLAHISCVIKIDSMVTNDQKVTIELRKQGESVSMFHQIYNKSTTASLPDVAAGSYKLLAVTGSISTAKGVVGETGSADYHVTVSTSDATTPPPAAIPLPAAAVPGAATLGCALIASRRRKH